jgi:D-alanyl-D-alanine carboxypeptidase/D-alanyl-D-alanine-endopeptidase (penicillin-binding protein 4)
MTRFLFALMFALLLFGCASRPTKVPSTPPTFASLLSESPYPAIKTAIDTLVSDTLFPPSNVGIKVVSLRSGETLYALNADMLFNPASNEKLFTAAAALSVLGEDHSLSTVFTIDSAAGIIGVKAHGDPILSTEDADSIAGLLARLLPPRESWELVCDVSYFDDLHRGSGWTWDSEPAAYAAYITPFILNRNTIQVSVQPGAAAGDTVIVEIDPFTNYISIENHGVTVRDTVIDRLRISRKWRERSNVLTVTGETIDTLRGRKVSLSVWDPDKYAATVLAERLNRVGVPVGPVTVDTTELSGTEILRFSHRLDSAVTFMTKVSDNLTAEALLKILSAERFGPPGSAEGGIHVLHQFLSENGVDTTRIVLADGSGVSRYNLTSASAIVELLHAMHRSERHFPSFYRSLPVAGVDGTLWYRMKGTMAEGNLRAKTGTLSGVSALSGYVTTRDGELLSFSILMQNYQTSSRRYRKVQDGIGRVLAESSREK